MKNVFVDTAFWVATIDPADQHADAAVEAKGALGRVHLVTTEEVLVEVFSLVTRAPERVRRAAIALVRQLLRDPEVTVLPQSHQSFLAGLDLYEKRLDQGYSLVDCISMSVMRRRRVREALTSDGTTIVLRQPRQKRSPVVAACDPGVTGYAMPCGWATIREISGASSRAGGRKLPRLVTSFAPPAGSSPAPTTASAASCSW